MHAEQEVRTGGPDTAPKQGRARGDRVEIPRLAWSNGRQAVFGAIAEVRHKAIGNNDSDLFAGRIEGQTRLCLKVEHIRENWVIR
ncbi:MAG UNVERIFIED_CONTAM: hypothetical protein LVR18_51640 [Planctomycetaceae bacterium]